MAEEQAPVEGISQNGSPAPVGAAEPAREPARPGGGSPATEHQAVEDPVEILVGMAERGEIDPWNINIIEVTDRFLDELDRRRQLNLRISGRTLFYAATLLRMKSEQLAEADGQDEAGEEEFGDDFDAALDDEFEYEGRLGVIEQLEREIQRRLDRKNLRKSPVTLFELIIELKNIEKEERRRRRLVDEDSLLPDADDVVSIAHDEGYQETAITVYQECLKCMIREEEMTLAELCQKLGWDVPEVYIPLLFLMLDGQCALRQEEFFGDVYVQVCRAGNSVEEMIEGGG
ncbi:MAG: segregation and condensation protein A [Methanoregula sp. PtaU1.Bin051]|nr:MAG: segregation and condensation protein A [Methanoregula sp. PtaU1.Bin051]